MVGFVPIQMLIPSQQRVSTFTSVSYEQGVAAHPLRPDAYHHLLFPQLYTPKLSPTTVGEYRRRLFKKWEREGFFQSQDAPVAWLYRQEGDGYYFEGWVGGFLVEDYRAGRIRKHENILSDKAHHIVEYFQQVHLNGSPVLVIHAPFSEERGIRSAVSNRPPFLSFLDEVGIRHTIWSVGCEELKELQEAFHRIATVYIGDGHHRCHAYDHYYRGKHGKAIMAFAVSSDQVRVFPFHRLIHPLSRLEYSVLEALFASYFGAAVDDDIPLGAVRLSGSEVGICWDGKVRIYDVTCLTGLPVEQVDEVLGEFRKGTAIGVSYLNGRLSADELMRRTRDAQGALIILPPVAIQRIFEYADRGKTLPPKATWIEPKMRSGLFLHRL